MMVSELPLWRSRQKIWQKSRAKHCCGQCQQKNLFSHIKKKKPPCFTCHQTALSLDTTLSHLCLFLCLNPIVQCTGITLETWQKGKVAKAHFSADPCPQQCIALLPCQVSVRFPKLGLPSIVSNTLTMHKCLVQLQKSWAIPLSVSKCLWISSGLCKRGIFSCQSAPAESTPAKNKWLLTNTHTQKKKERHGNASLSVHTCE